MYHAVPTVTNKTDTAANNFAFVSLSSFDFNFSSLLENDLTLDMWLFDHISADLGLVLFVRADYCFSIAFEDDLRWFCATVNVQIVVHSHPLPGTIIAQ